MIDKTILLVCIIWYFNTYDNLFFNDFIISCYNLLNSYSFLYNDQFYALCLDDETNDNLNDEINKTKSEVKKQIKYEDKYLDDIRKLSKEWIFTEVENNEISKLSTIYYNDYKNIKLNRIKELEKEISQDNDSFNFVENTLEERIELINSDGIKIFQEEINQLNIELTSEESIIKLKTQSEEKAKKYIIDKRLDNLKNCFVMENTPIGNVILLYDKDRETFKYYSNCNIPYRYLEVVCRKYVKIFNCRPIFVDIEEELKLFEEKQKEEKKKEELKNIKPFEMKKKDVFTKFKSYNKDGGGKISMAPAPKNSIPNKNIMDNKDEKILLKEKTNRYTYEGKSVNFNFLQKVEKKIFNKKLGLSFADFKKTIKNK